MTRSVGTGRDVWPSPRGSVMDISQPSSPVVSVDDNSQASTERWMTRPQIASMVNAECVVRMIGIQQDVSVLVCRTKETDALTDSGSNSYMAYSEMHLVDSHDIMPMTVWLALTSDDTPVMYECTQLGYLPMMRDDGIVHRQPFLVNPQATDCMLSPDTIAQHLVDCTRWR